MSDSMSLELLLTEVGKAVTNAQKELAKLAADSPAGAVVPMYIIPEVAVDLRVSLQVSDKSTNQPGLIGRFLRPSESNVIDTQKEVVSTISLKLVAVPAAAPVAAPGGNSHG